MFSASEEAHHLPAACLPASTRPLLLLPTTLLLLLRPPTKSRLEAAAAPPASTKASTRQRQQHRTKKRRATSPTRPRPGPASSSSARDSARPSPAKISPRLVKSETLWLRQSTRCLCRRGTFLPPSMLPLPTPPLPRNEPRRSSAAQSTSDHTRSARSLPH